MTIKLKRVYDKTAKSDGTRILVDRLWPRGVLKEEANIMEWAKEMTPSSDLRKWFHEDPNNRFKTFEKKYLSELKRNRAVIKKHLSGYQQNITLVTSVKDIEHSHIPTLKKFLETLHK